MIFVDTGAWFAAFVPNDPDFPAADVWLEQNTEPLVTTDYVLDELLTLFKRRGEYERAVRSGPKLLSQEIAAIEWVNSDDVTRAWEIYESFRDKAWSFTDCVSYAAIERLEIDTAFSFDEHFFQFGIVNVVPTRKS